MAVVAICVPSGTMMHAATSIHLARLTAYSAVKGVQGEVFGVQCSDISEARNRLVDDALPYNVSHIFWLDSDMTFERDTLLRLLAHDKDIVGAFYSNRVEPYRMVGELEAGGDLTAGGVQKAKYLPGGCMLVKANVYKELAAPWYEERYNLEGATPGNRYGFISDDVWFCNNAKEAGYDIWCDVDISQELEHCGNTNLKLKFQNDPLQQRNVPETPSAIPAVALAA